MMIDGESLPCLAVPEPLLAVLAGTPCTHTLSIFELRRLLLSREFSLQFRVAVPGGRLGARVARIVQLFSNQSLLRVVWQVLLVSLVLSTLLISATATLIVD